MEKYSHIFIVSGPSGAGEDSIINGLSRIMPIERVITTTTRAPREGESQGNPYYFTSLEDFQAGIANGRFEEYAQQYNGNFYGVTQQELDRVESSGKIGIWKIEYQGVMSMKAKYPALKAVLVTVESLDILEQRIRRRDTNATDAYIQERMAYTREWLKHADIYDTVVVNIEGKLEAAIQQVAEYIQEGVA